MTILYVFKKMLFLSYIFINVTQKQHFLDILHRLLRYLKQMGLQHGKIIIHEAQTVIQHAESYVILH